MKRLFSLLIVVMTVLGLSAQTKKAVVAYFSATGNTEKVAKQLAKEKKAALYAIQPAKKYTAENLDYRNQNSRSSVEMSDKNARPAMKGKKSLAKYDVIYLGYPIWWGVAPRIINTFIEQAKMEGKTVIPFATSGSSTIEKSVSELKASYPQINWQEGMLKK